MAIPIAAALAGSKALIGSKLAGTAGKSGGLAASGLVKEYVKPLALYAPNRYERMYRKQIMDQARSLGAQGGAFAPGEREQAIAGGVGQVSSAQEERMAQLARQGGASSAMVQDQQRKLMQDSLAARGQVASAVRDVDVQEYAKEIAKSQKDTKGLGDAERKKREQALAVQKPVAETDALLSGMKASDKYSAEQIETIANMFGAAT